MTPPYSHELDFAIGFVRQVLPLARRMQKELVGHNTTKHDRSPVTVADFTIQALFAHELKQSFPSDGLIGEESSAILKTDSGMLDKVLHYVQVLRPSATRDQVCSWIDHANSSSKRFWILDPIDGTKGFIRGEHYAIALALVNGSRVSLGVLGCPHLTREGKPEIGAAGAIVFAETGKGAWSLSPDQDHKPISIHVSTQPRPEKAVLLGSVDAGHTDKSQLKKLMEILKVETLPKTMDSQAKYAVLAAGHGDFFLYLLPPMDTKYRMKIWDVAPGAIIAEEAGGKVTDLKGQCIDYSCYPKLERNPGILVSNGFLHDSILKAVASLPILSM